MLVMLIVLVVFLDVDEDSVGGVGVGAVGGVGVMDRVRSINTRPNSSSHFYSSSPPPCVFGQLNLFTLGFLFVSTYKYQRHSRAICYP